MIAEKNWVPLIPKTKESTLLFLRNLFPLDLVEVNLQEKTTRFSPNATTLLRAEPKSWKWGSLSGGTQAELIGDRYFSFFHSWYLAANGKRIYVLGACTFNTSPPFTMKEISPYPILFKELYTAKACGIVGNPYGLKWAQNLEKVIFPCGFVETTLASGRKVFHLSCGENDNSIRIITFDKEALLKSLIPVQN
jgi:hypothetical protein